MNRLTIIIVAVVAALYVIFSSLFVVNERQQAIVMRFGEITRVHTEPGLYWKVPTDLIETVQFIEDRLLREDLEDIRLQVADGRFYIVDAFVTYRIVDPIAFRQGVSGNIALLEERLNTQLNAALRDIYGRRVFEAALSEQRNEMMREARDLLRRNLQDQLGIEVVDVRVLRTDLTPQVSQQTFDRMSAERLAEAALLRARGQELAQTLRAQADRQAIEIVASANRDGEIIRGEGDAQRNRIYAEAYNLDQGFFDFYRSLEAYRTALIGSQTSIVLSPDSEFFRYFGQDRLELLLSEPATPADQVPDLPELDEAEPAVTLSTDESGNVTIEGEMSLSTEPAQSEEDIAAEAEAILDELQQDADAAAQ